MMPPSCDGRLLLVAAHDVDAAHERAVLLRAHLDDFAVLALVAAGEHDDVVALLDLERCHHSTSGASETIFMWFLALQLARHGSEDAGADRLALRR